MAYLRPPHSWYGIDVGDKGSRSCDQSAMYRSQGSGEIWLQRTRIPSDTTTDNLEGCKASTCGPPYPVALRDSTVPSDLYRGVRVRVGPPGSTVPAYGISARAEDFVDMSSPAMFLIHHGLLGHAIP